MLDPRWVDTSYGILGFDVLAPVLPAFNLAGRFSYDFFAAYATPWPTHEIRTTQLYNKWLTLHIHLRSFCSGVKPYNPLERGMKVTGLKLEREHASLHCVDDSNVLNLAERRYSLAVQLHPSAAEPYGYFVIISLVDFSGGSRWPLGDWTQTLDDFGLLPSRMLTGIVYFQCAICNIIRQWSADWSITLLDLEKTFGSKIGDVLDKNNVQNYMYDNEDLDRSQFYFSLLQLLRISSERIKRSMDDLKLAAEECGAELLKSSFRASVLEAESDSRKDFDGATKIIIRNWDVVLALHKKEGKVLLDRIDQNTKAVKSLRDGLFNAQSVRETVRSTKINQYLLVFTVVTIVFLPPSFVATQYNFWITFVSVALATYLSAIIGLSGVNQRKELKEWLGKRADDGWSWLGERPKADNSEAAVGGDNPSTSSRVPDDEGEEIEANRNNPFTRFRQRRTSRDLEKADKGKMPERINYLYRGLT
ncbi:hypothetical protein F5Y06DRAFT_298648 [Hypoxylon sp. FL0890]|nr:hypothetical protein F5Y06DRAFT_298648 [Hypoxylon sp. FL0890]